MYTFILHFFDTLWWNVQVFVAKRNQILTLTLFILVLFVNEVEFYCMLKNVTPKSLIACIIFLSWILLCLFNCLIVFALKDPFKFPFKIKHELCLFYGCTTFLHWINFHGVLNKCQTLLELEYSKLNKISRKRPNVQSLYNI